MFLATYCTRCDYILLDLASKGNDSHGSHFSSSLSLFGEGSAYNWLIRALFTDNSLINAVCVAQNGKAVSDGVREAKTAILVCHILCKCSELKNIDCTRRNIAQLSEKACHSVFIHYCDSPEICAVFQSVCFYCSVPSPCR